MARSANTISVSSEAAAWRTLEAVLERGMNYRRGEIDLGDWAKIELKFWVGDKQAVINPSMMRAFLDIQDAILRTRLIAIEQSTDLRGLSRDERAAYEIEVFVSPGSSGIDIDVTEIAKHLIGEMVTTMPPEYVLVVALCAVLAWAGNSMWRAWLESRKETALAGVEAGRQKDLLEAQKFASEVDLRRWELFAEAQQKFPAVADIEKAVEKGRIGVLKAAAQADRSKIAQRIVNPDLADIFAASPVPEEQTGTISGIFDVLAVDATVRDGFRIKVESRETGERFHASVRDLLLSQQDVHYLQRGEWEKKGVIAEVSVSRRNGMVFKAQIDSVAGIEGEIVDEVTQQDTLF